VRACLWAQAKANFKTQTTHVDVILDHFRTWVRFPPPPLLKTSDCLWLATPPIASDQIVTVVGSARRRFVEFGDGVFES